MRLRPAIEGSHNRAVGITRPAVLPSDVSVPAPGARMIGVRLAGATSGPLVIYMHGAPSSRLDVDFLHERSLRRGVRVAGMDRPGFGLSTPMPFTFQSVAGDAGIVADALGVARFAVFGQSSGVPYALATAVFLPDRVTAVATGGGMMPFFPGSAGFASLSEGEQRGVTLAGVDDAEAQRLLAEADLPTVQQLTLTDEEIEAAWVPHLSPADQRVFAAGFGRLIGPTMREALHQGQIGWARDNLVRMPRWDLDLHAVGVPATIWIGDEDASNVEGARWLGSEVPGAALRELPDHGHFIGLELWDEVLDSLGV